MLLYKGGEAQWELSVFSEELPLFIQLAGWFHFALICGHHFFLLSALCDHLILCKGTLVGCQFPSVGCWLFPNSVLKMLFKGNIATD